MKACYFTSIALAGLSALMGLTANADTVTTLPDGVKSSLYYRDATAIRKWGTGATKQEWETGIAADIAFTADGKTVYVRNGVGNYTEGYLVGAVAGNTVTFSFPQTIISGEDTFTVARMVRNEEEDAQSLYIPDPESQSVTFRLDGGDFKLNTEGALIGLLNSKMNWSGKILTEISYKKVDATEVAPPAGAETFNLALAYDLTDSARGDYKLYRLLPGCDDGEYIYINNIDSSLPDKWIRLKIDGDEVKVEGFQYLGVSGEYVMFFGGALDTPEWNAAYQVWEHSFKLTDGFSMKYDRKAGKLTATDSTHALCINPGDETYNYGTIYLNPSLTEQPQDISLIPQTPVMEEDVHHFMNGAEPELSFQLIPLNVDGQLLDTAHLGYKVYSNGEPYVFDGYEYWLDDDEDITFIPWMFQSAYIYSSVSGTQFIAFQEPYVQNITVRAVYIGADGKEYLSAALDPLNPTSGVNVVPADNRTVEVRYIGLDGTAAGVADQGIVVERTVYSNGEVKYRKVVR